MRAGVGGNIVAPLQELHVTLTLVFLAGTVRGAGTMSGARAVRCARTVRTGVGSDIVAPLQELSVTLTLALVLLAGTVRGTGTMRGAGTVRCLGTMSGLGTVSGTGTVRGARSMRGARVLRNAGTRRDGPFVVALGRSMVAGLGRSRELRTAVAAHRAARGAVPGFQLVARASGVVEFTLDHVVSVGHGKFCGSRLVAGVPAEARRRAVLVVGQRGAAHNGARVGSGLRSIHGLAAQVRRSSTSSLGRRHPAVAARGLGLNKTRRIVRVARHADGRGRSYGYASRGVRATRVGTSPDDAVVGVTLLRRGLAAGAKPFLGERAAAVFGTAGASASGAASTGGAAPIGRAAVVVVGRHGCDGVKILLVSTVG